MSLDASLVAAPGGSVRIEAVAAVRCRKRRDAEQLRCRVVTLRAMHHAAREMRSPILSIHPYIPAIGQHEDVICSMASRGDCDHKLVAQVRTEFSDGSIHHWRVCGEWLTSHPSAIAHIKTKGFQEPASP
ncbi:hypothetical protein RKD19_000386 [Streptomyces canus]